MVKYNSHIKPKLTDANKTARVKWAMDFIRPTEQLFDDIWDNVKEEWFDGKIARGTSPTSSLLPVRLAPPARWNCNHQRHATDLQANAVGQRDLRHQSKMAD
ncbi:hypothetical protein H310_02083 [Aphanomyces invadans]|uniref:Uncharacterized protein n=1 Tax=Aphanomyces invadans TaxID=157072 RepID=A0A024UP29_9STRA|nr:hypothetical protein H310_02083 [Aphanomyces invadans]ETW07607.1 hypothetical protein H310_02083 [Aphanomyces invadans]|eukprot:XP_008863700.1 hypothetical protein H310_02083 [Aphanomyces invadans]